MSDDRPRIGISACLLGQPVRFDSGHKRDPFLVETLGAHVEWVPVCPEVEAGFGTPRESMRLELTAPQVRGRGERFDPRLIVLVLNKQKIDVTAKLQNYSLKKAGQLASVGLSGYVLKKDSPSCGMIMGIRAISLNVLILCHSTKAAADCGRLRRCYAPSADELTTDSDDKGRECLWR